MRKFFRRQPSLDRYHIHRGTNSSKSLRRTSATCLNAKSIQVVRGAYNIDLNKVDASFTKLHRACLLNDDEQVKKHIQKVDTNSHDSSTRYPIHLATVNGNVAILKILISNGANPNVQDNEGNTPLVKAIECGHEHLVKYFLSQGADPNITDLEKNTALHWAIMTESIIAIDALMSSKKCDLMAKNSKDETCLHLAVRSPLINTSTFESFLRAGSDLTAKDQLGLTALDIAQACNNSTAMTAFNRHQQQQLDKNNDHNGNNINLQQVEMQANVAAINVVNLQKRCEEYKQKYSEKCKEKLALEQDNIRMKHEIERLKFDLTYIRDKNDEKEKLCAKLITENSKLNEELNFKMIIKNQQQNRSDNDDPAKQIDDNIGMLDYKAQQDFITKRAAGREKISHLLASLHL